MVSQGAISQDQGFLSFLLREEGLLGEEGFPGKSSGGVGSRWEGAGPSFLPSLVRPHIEFFGFIMCDDLGWALHSGPGSQGLL